MKTKQHMQSITKTDRTIYKAALVLTGIALALAVAVMFLS